MQLFHVRTWCRNKLRFHRRRFGSLCVQAFRALAVSISTFKNEWVREESIWVAQLAYDLVAAWDVLSIASVSNCWHENVADGNGIGKAGIVRPRKFIAINMSRLSFMILAKVWQPIQRTAARLITFSGTALRDCLRRWAFNSSDEIAAAATCRKSNVFAGMFVN